MARQMKAERDKRASILEAEGLRQAAILKAEGEKQGAILEAEGRKEAAFRDAEARERAAEAEAKATAMLSQALARGDRQAINYFVAQKYVEAFGRFATSPNQKVVFLPLEATSLLGSLGRHRRDRARGLRQAERRRERRGAPLMPVLEPLFWHWWAFGGALVIVEVFAPGFVFLWLGIAAALVGTLLWLWPGIGPDYQVLIFAALSVTSVLGWRRWRDAHPAPSDRAEPQSPRHAVHRPPVHPSRADRTRSRADPARRQQLERDRSGPAGGPGRRGDRRRWRGVAGAGGGRGLRPGSAAALPGPRSRADRLRLLRRRASGLRPKAGILRIFRRWPRARGGKRPPREARRRLKLALEPAEVELDRTAGQPKIRPALCAPVAKSVDAANSKSVGRKAVLVRVA